MRAGSSWALIPTVIDADPGIDDALALLLAWGSPELDVLALTVVAGNVPLADTARNAARLVAVRQSARPPQIALGAAGPLRRPLVTATHDQHGADGLGDAAPNCRVALDIDAARFLALFFHRLCPTFS